MAPPSRAVFPYEPLRVALEHRFPEIVVAQSNGQPITVHAGDLVRASDVLDVHRRVIWRWSNTGWMTLDAADRAATRLGVHGTAIWHDWYDLCARIDEINAAVAERRRTRPRSACTATAAAKAA